MSDDDILYRPDAERVATTNAWAFLHWLHTTAEASLSGWSELVRFSSAEPSAFRAAITRFAQLPPEPTRLARHPGPQEALALRPAGGGRLTFTRDQLATEGASLTAGIAAPLSRTWHPGLLVRPAAELLLHADLRPDDRVLLAGVPAWPWLVALLEGSTLILAASGSAALLTTAAEEQATVLVAPAGTLASAAFQRSRQRPDLSALRSIVATGGPLSPEGRRRIYTWVKPNLMLLARSGDTFWGNPLEPVLARPQATPAFLTPPASAPVQP